MLDWIPAQIRVVRITRRKLASRCCGILHQAPAPERVMAGGLATPGGLWQRPATDETTSMAQSGGISWLTQRLSTTRETVE